MFSSLIQKQLYIAMPAVKKIKFFFFHIWSLHPSVYILTRIKKKWESAVAAATTLAMKMSASGLVIAGERERERKAGGTLNWLEEVQKYEIITVAFVI